MRLFTLATLACVSLASFAVADDEAAYVGSAICSTCHQAEADAWKDSHHAKAWTPATPENIRADFEGTSFTLDDMNVQFSIDAEGKHRATVTERDGSVTDYSVHSVVGVEPLQQYLFETEPGRLQSFDVVWDTEKRDWFHLYPDQNVPPDDGLHWSGPYKNWNGRCAVCHATGYDANFDAETDSYSSQQVEIGVGCEACHGPGETHVGLTAAGKLTDRIANAGFSADLSTSEGLIQQCAGCHSRREALFDFTPPPGTPYHDAYNLSLLRPGLYYPDGQIRDEVYVYGSFLQSEMYEKGVSCSNCHDAHSGALFDTGNGLCTQCHSEAGNTDFPSLQLGDYDSPAHHHHAEGSAGAQCTSCHMTEQVYMGNDWRADHSFRIPRPDLSAQTGAPDACTSCHDDRDAGWAAATLRDWFPNSTKRGPHYGQVLAHAEVNPVAAADDLVALAEDDTVNALARATAVWLLGQSNDPQTIDRISGLRNAENPTIRGATIEAMRSLPGHQRVQDLLPTLDDPLRNVRIAAARALYNAPIARMPEKIEKSFRRAIGEWRRAIGARMDFPETHLQLGGFALTTRNLEGAEQAFARAVELDPKLVDAWVMRIRIANVAGQQNRTRALVAQALAANPGDLTLEAMAAEISGSQMNLLPPASE